MILIALATALSQPSLARPDASKDRLMTSAGRSRLLTPIGVKLRRVRIFGQPTAYYEAGSGSTVILIPHLGWDSNMWGQNFSTLARKHTVIAIDPLGQGQSAKPLLDYKMNTWTDQFAEFMRLKLIKKATFVGTGMGGALAVQMALDHPELVRSIVVAASSSGPGPHLGGSGNDASLSSLEGSRQLLHANIYDSSLVTDELVRARLEYRLRANDGYTIQRHMSDHRPPYSPAELEKIRVPSLFLWCRQDEITPPSWGADFAAGTPGSSFKIIENCGHFPNLEQPVAFNSYILSFLDPIAAP
jgi:pimeloyl-ACP methyl ester carboxylesterase